eukprot:scaffold45146_cov14-Tisochrysis_lutea.AAC.1
MDGYRSVSANGRLLPNSTSGVVIATALSFTCAHPGTSTNECMATQLVVSANCLSAIYSQHVTQIDRRPAISGTAQLWPEGIGGGGAHNLGLEWDKRGSH